jgi:tetratricopeptide (TPR) repeat protein
MNAHQTTQSDRDHELNVRCVRFRHRPDREEPALFARELLAADRATDALEVIDLALANEPGDHDLLLARAHALLATGQARHGEEALIRVAKASPDWAAPLSALTRLLAARGDGARALGMAQRARTLGADDTTVGRIVAADETGRKLDARLDRFRSDGAEEPVMLSRALEGADRLADAERVLREAMERDPDDADTLAALARLERIGGRTDEAVELYRRARTLAPGWDTAERALLSLVGIEVPIEIDEPAPTAIAAAPSPMDLDAELDALVGSLVPPRGDATICFRLEPRTEGESETTLVGAPAIANAYVPRTARATEMPRAPRRTASGFPSRSPKKTASSVAAYVRVLAGDARRHVSG